MEQQPANNTRKQFRVADEKDYKNAQSYAAHLE
jgi:hypothetical protein